MRKISTGFLPLITLDRESARPLHLQIYEQVRAAIAAGKLKAKQLVPSTRALANELHVSRITVLNAFAQLTAEGYLETRRGGGTYVCGALPDVPPEGKPLPSSADLNRRPISKRSADIPHFKPTALLYGRGAFAVGQVALDDFPISAWSRLFAAHTRNLRASSMYFSDPLGSIDFRTTIAAYLRTVRGVNCDPEQIMVVSGSQQAIEIATRVLLDPGDSVWVEEPGYRLARNVVRMSNCRVIPVPIDKEGMNVEAGIEICPTARVAMVTPSHQFPTGVMMSPSRRVQLLEWAQSSGAWIIEDDYDSEYIYQGSPILSLQGLDTNARVIYIGTFSKTLFPSLRVGYVVIPKDLVEHFVAIRVSMDVNPPYIVQAVLTDFMNQGHHSRHIRRMRMIYSEKRKLLVSCVQNEIDQSCQLQGAEAGLHVLLTLPPEISDKAVSKAAEEQNLWLWPLSPMYSGPLATQGLVLGFGSVSNERIGPAVQKMKSVLANVSRELPR
jgi:GntR family transcriptional regulator / MocR family aminotransferase